jgi:DNA-binding transcriptional regulator YdaS (Cro superfamily)
MTLDDIVKRTGGQAELARLMRISPQAIHQWRQSGKVPAERVLDLERVSGVPRTAIRPDLYPVEG